LFDESNIGTVWLDCDVELAPGVGTRRLVNGVMYGRILGQDKFELQMAWGPDRTLYLDFGGLLIKVPFHRVVSWIGD
jgi:hypothetical protein